jgi:hypothetical protein
VGVECQSEHKTQVKVDESFKKNKSESKSEQKERKNMALLRNDMALIRC